MLKGVLSGSLHVNLLGTRCLVLFHVVGTNLEKVDLQCDGYAAKHGRVDGWPVEYLVDVGAAV